jgi:hypothetical protein
MQIAQIKFYCVATIQNDSLYTIINLLLKLFANFNFIYVHTVK